MSHLSDIQQALIAPKGQRNEFGKFNYRSCEDILAAVKPLLREAGLALVLEDDILEVGERVYVKATARLLNGDAVIGKGQAFAREPQSKKGMDDSQITGSTSSYARKYALAGLFAIDDEKDADTMDNRQEKKSAPAPEPRDMTGAIRACTTLEMLQATWKGMTPAEHKLHTAIKDAKKAELSGA